VTAPTEPNQSASLTPGTRLRHKNGHVVTLGRRKVEGEARGLSAIFFPGWWLRGTDGGLADFVIDAENSDWTVLR